MMIVILKNTLPVHIGTFILSNSKRHMNNYIREKDGFRNNNIYYSYTESLHIEHQYWDVLDKAKLVVVG